MEVNELSKNEMLKREIFAALSNLESNESASISREAYEYLFEVFIKNRVDRGEI